MRPAPQKRTITEDFLIVGEGAGDQELFKHLCAVRGIAGYQFENAGGLDNLEAWLRGLPVWGEIQRLKLLIVVADCDDSPKDNYLKVRKSLKNAKLPYCENPFFLAKAGPDKPATKVIMIPFTPPSTANRGCLETLLLTSATANFPQYVGCLNDYSACVGADNWPLASHIDKLRLRVLLSSAYPDDPNLSLPLALNPERGLIPLDHASFDPLEKILRDTPTEL